MPTPLNRFKARPKQATKCRPAAIISSPGVIEVSDWILPACRANMRLVHSFRNSLMALIVGGGLGLVAAKTGVLGAKEASAAPMPRASAKGPLGENADIRFALVDAQTGKPISNQRGDEVVALQSAHNVIVAGAALKHLNPAFRFRTNYVAKGRLKRGVIWGDLVIEGRGDPTIDEVRTAWVAQRLVSAGLTRITGKIIVDDTWYLPRPPQVPAAPDDAPPIPKAFTGPYHPTAALQFNDGQLGAGLYHRGRSAEVRLAPAVYGERLTHDVRAGDFAHRPRAMAFQPVFAPPHVFVAGVVGPKLKVVSAPIENEALTCGYSLLRELVRLGVRVNRRVAVERAPVGHRWIMSNISQPLTHLLRRGLSRSDIEETRLFAALLRRMGTDHGDESGTLENGAAKATAVLADISKVPTARLQVGGAEGESLASPQAVVAVLSALFRDYDVQPDLLRVIGQGKTHRPLRALFGQENPLLPNLRVVTEYGPGFAEMTGFVRLKDGQSVALYWRASAAGATTADFVAAQNGFLSQIVRSSKGQ